MRRAVLGLAIFAVLLCGCEGGTISNYSQSCSSTGGFLEGRTVRCSGEAQSLSGSVGIEFGDSDDEEEELSGTYRLTAEISVDKGEARLYSYDAEGERLPLGTVSADAPLRIADTVIEPSNESSVFFVDAGEETVEGLKYEGTIEPV